MNEGSKTLQGTNRNREIRNSLPLRSQVKKRKKKSTAKRPRGRYRVHYTYDEARDIARREGISSVGEYAKWWKLNQPVRMPKRPDRSYKNINFKWSEFLGVKNIFPTIRKSYVTYDECKLFAHRNNIKSNPQWREFLRNNKKPENIPAHPELIYRGSAKTKGEWISYNDFFGTKPLQKIETINKMQEYLIIYKIDSKTNNMFYFSQKLCSPETLLTECKKILENYEIYAVYLVGSYNYRKFLSEKYSEMVGVSNCFKIENINDLYFNFDINMTNKIKDVVNSL